MFEFFTLNHVSVPNMKLERSYLQYKYGSDFALGLFAELPQSSTVKASSGELSLATSSTPDCRFSPSLPVFLRAPAKLVT